MANEIISISNDTNLSFTSKKLTSATRHIANYYTAAGKNVLKIAAELARVNSESLYADDFGKFEEYTEQVFNLKKAMAYHYSAIGKDFVARNEKGNPTGESVLPHNTVDYTVTKLAVLVPVGVETATEWANEGKISPEMTVKELKQVVADWKEENTVDTEATEQGSNEGTAKAETTEAMNAPAEEVQDAAEVALQNMLQALTTLKSDERFKDCGEQFKAIEKAMKEIETKF